MVVGAVAVADAVVVAAAVVVVVVVPQKYFISWKAKPREK
jgi:hypothetical protein